MRHRNAVVPLDSALVLTHGNPLGPAGMLGQLHPSRGSFTGVVDRDEGPKLIGQFSINQGEEFARMAFFLPESSSESKGLLLLLQGMASMAGEWDAHNLVAEVPESSSLFEQFRHAGFTVYGWQHVWKAPAGGRQETGKSSWYQPSSSDYLTVKNLYQYLLPPIVQSAEPFPASLPGGRVLRFSGETVGWAAVKTGLHGVFVLPLLHPEVKNVPQVLSCLEAQLHRETRLPVFFGVRSYQTWLEPALESMDWQVMPRQALMVKRLAILQKAALPAVHAIRNEQRAEPTTPILGFDRQGNESGAKG